MYLCTISLSGINLNMFFTLKAALRAPSKEVSRPTQEISDLGSTIVSNLSIRTKFHEKAMRTILYNPVYKPETPLLIDPSLGLSEIPALAVAKAVCWNFL